ncbi:MAG: hypothetical protein AAGU11_09350 [Syntrophobacteraceae bacterium]
MRISGIMVLVGVLLSVLGSARTFAVESVGGTKESLYLWCGPSPCIFPGFPPCWRLGIRLGANEKEIASRMFGPAEDLNPFLNNLTLGDYEPGTAISLEFKVEDMGGKLLASGSVTRETRTDVLYGQDFIDLAIPIDVIVHTAEAGTRERHKNTVHLSLGVTIGKGVRLDPEDKCYPIPCNAIDQWICGNDAFIAQWGK